jgi:hypothetical protein
MIPVVRRNVLHMGDICKVVLLYDSIARGTV